MKEIELYSIIKAPHSTEKTEGLAEKFKQIVFKVGNSATKLTVKLAVENIFQVQVAAVRIIKVKGKARNFRNTKGQRSDWKKALVSLKPGYDINFAEFK